MSLTDTAEIIGIIRDVAFLLLFLALILVPLILYRKVSAILSSAKRTMENTEEIVSTVSGKVVGPAAAGTGVAFAAGKLAAFVLGFSKKRSRSKAGGKDDG